MNTSMHTPYPVLTAVLLLTVVFAPTGHLRSQSCSNPLALCAEAPDGSTTIIDSAPLSFDCMDVQNTFFYEFTSNSNTTNVGNAVIEVGGISCPGTVDNTVFAAIIEISDPSDPCNPANWSIMDGTCYQDTAAFTITTPDLSTSTSYFLLLGTNQPPDSSNCAMDVSISGPAVDIDACCDNNITLGESHTFSVFGGDVNLGYTWDPVSWLDNFASDSPTSFPEETVTYTATGYVDSCPVTDAITIFVLPPIDPYTGITPNGDGYNDTWEIPGISRFENASVTVFDRWGQQVYRSIGYSEPWDGTNNGKFLPTATYYWVIELNSQEVAIAPITGFVTIVH